MQKRQSKPPCRPPRTCITRAARPASTPRSIRVWRNFSPTWWTCMCKSCERSMPSVAVTFRSTRSPSRCFATRTCVRRCARGDDPDRLIGLYIGLINRIVRRRPAGMTIGVHMCRGNAMGKWMASGSYERIAERTFNTLEADAFFLEYDPERAGGFEPLRFVPRHKKVILGLVSTKTPVLESKEFLSQRSDQAALHLTLENLALSPQCGFASHARGSALSFEQQEAKLRRVVETAGEVWGWSPVLPGLFWHP